MTTDREMAEAHARKYHEAVIEASADGHAPDYRVWSWDEMPSANRQLLIEASLVFSSGRDTSAEQLAIAMQAMARRLFQMGGTIGEDEHGFRNMGDQLAGWASDVRQLGVAHHVRVAELDGRARRDGDRAHAYFQSMKEANAKLDAVQRILLRITNTSDPKFWVEALEEISEVVDDQ